MSLIHTAERCGADPFDYLVELQKHAAELAKNPGLWMPWNYRETLERAVPHHGLIDRRSKRPHTTTRPYPATPNGAKAK